VAARFKAWVCSRLVTGNAGWNPDGDMAIWLLWVVCCQVWSLVQKCPTECGASECDYSSTETKHRRFRPVLNYQKSVTCIITEYFMKHTLHKTGFCVCYTTSKL